MNETPNPSSPISPRRRQKRLPRDPSFSIKYRRILTRHRYLVLFPPDGLDPRDPDALARRRSGFCVDFAERLRFHFHQTVTLTVAVIGDTDLPLAEPNDAPVDSHGLQLLAYPALNAVLVEGPQTLGPVLHHRKRQRQERVALAPYRILCRRPKPPQPHITNLTEQHLWHLGSSGVNAPRETARLGALDPHDRPTAGQGVWVGFVDTGIDATHQEFAGKPLIHKRVSKTGKLYKPPFATDLDGHGTFCAALTCGRRCGVAPGASIAMVAAPLDIDQPGSDVFQQILTGAEYLLTVPRPDGKYGVDILNFSLGVVRSDEINSMRKVFAELRQINNNPVICAASGNSPPGPEGYAHCPATLRGVWSIGAHDSQPSVWHRSCFSIKGSPGNPRFVPSLFAPGTAVVSAATGGGYTTMDGTSMACAVASGVAASDLAAARVANPSINARDINPRTTGLRHGNLTVKRLLCRG
jgi:subtilase family protein